MRLTRSVAIVVALTVSPLAASAECAWVLWSNSVALTATGSSMSWAVRRGFQTASDCDKGAELEATDYAQATRGSVTKAPRGPSVMNLGLGAVDFVCLPDTVDPRAPKTK